MIYPKISLNKLEVELEKAFAKSEWEDVKKNIENEKREKKIGIRCRKIGE